MDLNTLAYFIAGLIGLVIIINTLGAIRPAARPQQHITVQKSKPLAGKPQQPNVTLDAELCKQYPLINTAYKNGYRFASYDPLIMELRE